MTFKAKQKILVAAVFIALAFLLLLGMGAYPLSRGIAKLSSDIATQRAQLGEIEQDQRNVREFRLYSRDRAAELDRTEDVFVNARTPVEFLEHLEGAALQSGTVIQIAPAAAVRASGDHWDSMRIRIAGESSYPQFRSFLHLLENSPYLLEVLDIQIQGGESEAVSFSLGLKAYAQ